MKSWMSMAERIARVLARPNEDGWKDHLEIIVEMDSPSSTMEEYAAYVLVEGCCKGDLCVGSHGAREVWHTMMKAAREEPTNLGRLVVIFEPEKDGPTHVELRDGTKLTLPPEHYVKAYHCFRNRRPLPEDIP